MAAFTWLHDDGDVGRVLLPGGVRHGQLEGVVALLHGGQLQDWSAHTLRSESSVDSKSRSSEGGRMK